MTRLVIATRRSRLALWQAEHVRSRLAALGHAVELLPMSTRGDELLQASLAEAGGKGLFIKELENALADGRADLAVHSMKDMPAELPPGFTLAAITARDDPRDAFVSERYGGFDELPPGSVVGTSSLRRQAQVLERFPALQVRPLRGNVDTRLAKLERGEYAAKTAFDRRKHAGARPGCAGHRMPCHALRPAGARRATRRPGIERVRAR